MYNKALVLNIRMSAILIMSQHYWRAWRKLWQIWEMDVLCLHTIATSRFPPCTTGMMLLKGQKLFMTLWPRTNPNRLVYNFKGMSCVWNFFLKMLNDFSMFPPICKSVFIGCSYINCGVVPFMLVVVLCHLILRALDWLVPQKVW